MLWVVDEAACTYVFVQQYGAFLFLLCFILFWLACSYVDVAILCVEDVWELADVVEEAILPYTFFERRKIEPILLKEMLEDHSNAQFVVHIELLLNFHHC